ncbi:AbiTii domain-containing protein [Sphingobium ummariense]|uniref:AbiTii domain-containing protein n=1 Tax=Sphingobium ummariense TaxID=420994 RepID=UPI00126801AD|nr:hypothetical protein [Sphingobium ummariense]
MAGLVEDIQAQSLDNGVSTTDLLRKVKLAAVKLQLSDAVEWVDAELKGYQSQDAVPDYRRTLGQVKAHNPIRGPMDVGGDPEMLRKIATQIITEPISQVEKLAGDGTGEVIGKLHEELIFNINKYNGGPHMDYYVHISSTVFYNICQQVRNLVLDWAIGLEKAGILGEGISFTVEEKRKAAENAQNINIENFTGHLHSGNITGHQNRTVIGSTDNSVNSLEQSTVFEQLEQAIADNVRDDEHRRDLVDIIKQMQATQGTAEYKPWFQKLVGYAAEYATVLGPFLPALSQFVS